MCRLCVCALPIRPRCALHAPSVPSPHWTLHKGVLCALGRTPEHTQRTAAKRTFHVELRDQTALEQPNTPTAPRADQALAFYPQTNQLLSHLHPHHCNWHHSKLGRTIMRSGAPLSLGPMVWFDPGDGRRQVHGQGTPCACACGHTSSALSADTCAWTAPFGHSARMGDVCSHVLRVTQSNYGGVTLTSLGQGGYLCQIAKRTL